MCNFKKGSNIVWNNKIYQVIGKNIINSEIIINYNNNLNHKINLKNEKVENLANIDDYVLVNNKIFKVISLTEKNFILYELQDIINEKKNGY